MVKKQIKPFNEKKNIWFDFIISNFRNRKRTEKGSIVKLKIKQDITVFFWFVFVL